MTDIQDGATAAEIPKVKARVRAKPKAKDAKPAPMTSEEFSASLAQLMEQARGAGVNTLQVMAGNLAKRGLTALDGFLGAIDAGDEKKPKKKKK